jgi:hypothetical protein
VLYPLSYEGVCIPDRLPDWWNEGAQGRRGSPGHHRDLGAQRRPAGAARRAGAFAILASSAYDDASPVLVNVTERRFLAMTSGPDPLKLDCAALGCGLPAAALSLDEVRILLFKRRTSWVTKGRRVAGAGQTSPCGTGAVDDGDCRDDAGRMIMRAVWSAPPLARIADKCCLDRR